MTTQLISREFHGAKIRQHGKKGPGSNYFAGPKYPP